MAPVIDISRGTYKPALNSLHNKLQVALQAQEEWRQVAENRKALLHTLNCHLDTMLRRACDIQGIFGVKADAQNFPRSNIGVHTGVEIYKMCRLKIEALETFTARLTTEALEVQIKLQGVLELAIEAIPVNRPESDLQLPDQALDDPETRVSPIDELFEEYTDPVEHDGVIYNGPEFTENTDLTSALVAMRGLSG